MLDMSASAWKIESDDECAAYAMHAKTSETEGLEPRTINEAQKWPDWLQWDEAIMAELKSLKDAHTWDVIPCPPKPTNIVNSKWIFKIKKTATGKINKYKARLVTCGFTQVHGVDYYETYAPVACLSSLCLILTIAA